MRFPSSQSPLATHHGFLVLQAVYDDWKILPAAWKGWAAGVSNYQVPDPIAKEHHRFDSCPLD